ncbi:MAG: hypothetical protein Q9192_005743, partial [Flavoplaca navasiana]
KIRRIRDLIKFLGGARAVAKMLLKAKTFKQLIIIGGPELQELAEILLGVQAVAVQETSSEYRNIEFGISTTSIRCRCKPSYALEEQMERIVLPSLDSPGRVQEDEISCQDHDPRYDFSVYSTRIWDSSTANVKDADHDATGQDEEFLAEVSSNFEIAKSDPDMDILMAADENTPSGFVIDLKREKGTFTRKHRITLSDGKTYVVRGKHSDNLMMCWGNLKVVEKSSKSKLAEFKVEWWMSTRKIGIVTFLCEIQEHLMKEILFVLVGVASREYSVAIASMGVAIPAASAGA